MTGRSVTVFIMRDGLEVSVEGIYHRGDPGNLCGLPEDCYPAEPSDLDVTFSKFLESGESVELTEAEYEDVIQKADAQFESMWEDPGYDYED